MAMSWRTWSYFSSMANAKGSSPSQTRAVRLAGAQTPALPRSLACGNKTHLDARFAIRPEIENESQPERKSLCFAALDSFGPACPRIPEACAVQKCCTKLGCKPPKIRYTAYFAKPVQVTQWRPNASTTLLPEAKQGFRVISLRSLGFYSRL